MGYIYIASSQNYIKNGYLKIGLTNEPQNRLSTYLTGCPPNETKDNDIYFVKLWSIKSDNIRKYEKILHNNYKQYRLMRNIPNDTEWFKFPIQVIEDTINNIGKNDWIDKEEYITDINRKIYLNHNYHYNIDFIDDIQERINKLVDFQKPTIDKLINFFNNTTKISGKLHAPCGYGKGRVPIQAMKGIMNRVIILCPSYYLLYQWKQNILKEKLFDNNDILLISGNHQRSQEDINNHFNKNKFCIISTFLSSNKITKLDNIQCVIYDEAHHMTGILPKDDNIGVGCSRELIKRIKDNNLKIKQLFLTFTPKTIHSIDEDIKYLSMDDDIFGYEIANINFREMVNIGVLPDYRVWTIRDRDTLGEGLIAKVDMIKECWKSKECIKDSDKLVERFILNKLIVFAKDHYDATKIYELLKDLDDTDVLYLEKDENSIKKTNEFRKKNHRSIIINCKKLGEGVDIPEADSVIIMYPKSSTIEIIQMLLRPGRWYINKPIFHMLIPILDDEDIGGLERVLVALADVDPKIVTEIEIKMKRMNGINSHTEIKEYMDEEIENIIIDSYEGGNIEDIKNCFIRVRNRQFNYNELTYEQMKQKIANLSNKPYNKTTYKKLCMEDPIYPENPDEYYNNDWKGWINYLGIERAYYDLEACIKRVNELKKEIKDIDLSIICTKLCSMDPLFPPDEMWVDYYMNDGINKLNDIIKTSIISKFKGLTL
jgi:superfamily II DNA or RNA helicase